MKSDQEQLKKAAQQLGKAYADQKKTEPMVDKVLRGGFTPKDMIGMTDEMVEGIYGQAYRLYNNGKYQDAIQLFRLLVMADSTDPKFIMGLAACFHMMKEYKNAGQIYSLCGMVDPGNPIPHYHASDCFIKLGDLPSAIVELKLTIDYSEGKPEYQTIHDRAKMNLKAVEEELHKKMEGASKAQE